MSYTTQEEYDFYAYGSEFKNGKLKINVAGGGCFEYDTGVSYAYANVEIDLILNNIKYVKYGWGPNNITKRIKYKEPILIFEKNDDDDINYDSFSILENGEYTGDDFDLYQSFIESLSDTYENEINEYLYDINKEEDSDDDY